MHSTHLCTFARPFKHTLIHTFTHLYIYAHPYTHMHTPIHICTHLHTYARCAPAVAHTHTHQYISSCYARNQMCTTTRLRHWLYTSSLIESDSTSHEQLNPWSAIHTWMVGRIGSSTVTAVAPCGGRAPHRCHYRNRPMVTSRV